MIRPVRRWTMLAQPILLPAGTNLGGTPVLPDNRVVEWPAGRPFPEDGRLALIGDTDRSDRSVRRGQNLAAGGHHSAPNLFGIVLNPARFWVVLGQFDLRGRADLARRIE